MELTTSNKRHEIQVCNTDPRCIALRNQYGSVDKFYNLFAPAKLDYISQNINKSVDAGVPSLIRVMRTYGREAVEALLADHLTAMLVRMGRPVSDVESIERVARNICEITQARTLNLAMVLGFFKAVELAEHDDYEIYNAAPIQVMKAFRKYCTRATARQEQLLRDKERREQATKKEVYVKPDFDIVAEIHRRMEMEKNNENN